MLARRLGKRGGLQNLTCFLLLPIVASNSCRAGKAQTSTWESGGDFSIASTLQSKIKNQKSKIKNRLYGGQSRDFHVRVGRRFLDHLDSSIKNQKSKIDCTAGKAEISTSELGGDFSIASTLQSKIKNQKSKIDR